MPRKEILKFVKIVNNIENNIDEVGLFPRVCPRCHSLLGAFELGAHILARAQYINDRWVCYECLTDKEKVIILEDYITFREKL